MSFRSIFATLFLVFFAAAQAAKGNGAPGKKAGGLTGGHHVMQMKDVPSDAIEAALGKFESSRDALEGMSNSMYKLSKPVIASVDSQIVSGVMYHFTVLAGQSDCRRGVKDVSSCSMYATPMRKALVECTIKVWSKPWENFMEAQNLDLDKDCGPSKHMIPEAV